MSRENVEAVQEGFEHFARTGAPLLEALDPDVEVHDHDIPDAGTYRGPAGFLKWLEDWSEPWADFTMEPQRWIDAGDQVVLVLQLTARGKGSGVEVRRRDAMVWTVRDGKTTRVDCFNDAAQGLEALGVSE